MMRSQITTHRDIVTGDLVFSGRICAGDELVAMLDDFDRAVINSPAENMADVLQSLQIIAFRICQRNPTDTGEHVK